MELEQWKASDGFAKSICPICFQGLNPIIEVIQSISVCGHVFHEFCLQQLLESLPGSKKKRCPICKQKFSQKHVSRLYLQWVEHQPKASATAKSPACGLTRDNARLLRGELVTLEEKLAFVDQGLEQQQECLRELKEELSIAKDLAGRETALKVEAVTENSIFQQMLNEKMEELEQSKAERSKLQDRILALEKELAANKLSYKEMMAQCDLLAGGAKSQTKLANAVQKKEKLKEKLKELKTVLGEKDNEILRKKEKMKEKLKKLKRALEEKDKEILRSSKICKRVHVEEAHENGNKLGYTENSRAIVKKKYAGGTPESCCTGLLSNHASDAKANAGFPEKQGASCLETSRTEIMHLDMEGQAYFQTEMDRSTNSQKGTWEQYSRKPTELVAEEQATPRINIGMIEERRPIFEGALGSCPQDNVGHSKLQATRFRTNSAAMITKEGRDGEKWSLSLTPQDPKCETGQGKTTKGCIYCGNPKHTRDTCFKLHGYPDGWRACKQKTGNRVGRSTDALTLVEPQLYCVPIVTPQEAAIRDYQDPFHIMLFCGQRIRHPLPMEIKARIKLPLSRWRKSYKRFG